MSVGPFRATPRCRLVSGAVSEGGHHVAPALCHCPAVLLGRAPEPGLAPGAVRVEGEHLLQVLKHVIEESSAVAAEAALLKVPLVSVHGLLVGLEVAVKVSLVAALVVGVEVVLVPLLLLLLLPEEVVKVERLVVLSEVVMASSSSSATTTSSSVVLPW